MRKVLQTLMLGSAFIMRTDTSDAVEDYKGPFSTQVLYTMCSSKNPASREKCNVYLQGLMYGLNIQVAMKDHNMMTCLPGEMTTEAARVNMLNFINTMTNGNPSSNGDSGDWIAYLSLETGHLCGQSK